MKVGVKILAGLACGVAMAIMPAAASADLPTSTPVQLSPAQLQESLFVAGDVSRLDGAGGETSLLEEMVLQDMYTVDPTLPTADGTAAIEQLNRSYTAAYPKGVVPDLGATRATVGDVTAELNAFNQIEPNVESGLKDLPAADATLDTALTDVSRNAVTSSDASVPGKMFDPNLLSEKPPANFLPQQVLQQTVQEGSTNKNFAGARDGVWQSASHESVIEPTSDLLKNNPALSDNPDLQAVYSDMTSSSSGNSVDTTLGEYQKDFSTDVNGVEADTETAGSQIQSLIAQDDADPSKTLQYTATTEGQLDTDQSILSNDEGALGFEDAVGSISEVEPAAADISEEVGTMAIEEVTTVAVDEAVDLAVSDIDPLMAIQMLSQAPTDIMSLINSLSGQPSPDELILQQLAAIQKQITALAQDVDSKFGTVEAGLSSLSATLSTDTNLLDNVQANVVAISGDMGQLTTQTAELRSDIYQIAQTQRDETLENDVSTAIGYSDRSPGNAPMSVDLFEQSAGTFFNWADSDPFDSISEVSSSVSNPDQVFAQLQTPADSDALGSQDPSGLDANLDFLATYAAQHGWSDPMTNSLPNPDVWATGANALAQLLFENPKYDTPTLIDELGQVANVGTGLQSTVQALTGPGSSYQPQTIDGVTFDTGSSVIDHAFVNYLSAGDGLRQAIDTEEGSWLNLHPQTTDTNCSPCALGSQAGASYINPWGGPNQTPSTSLAKFQTTAAPTGTYPDGKPGEIGDCSTSDSNSNPAPVDAEVQTDTFPVKDVANNVVNPLPNVYANAWHLGVGNAPPGTFSTCYTASFVSWNNVFNGNDGAMNVSLEWEYDGKPIFTLGFTTPTEDLCNDSGGPLGEVGESQAYVQLYDDWSPTTIGSNCPSEKSSDYYIEPIFNELATRVMQLAPGAAGVPIPTQGETYCTPPLGAASCFYAYNVVSNVQAAVSAKLSSLQTDIYDDIDSPGSGTLTSSNNVADAAVTLDGARTLLDDYTELALPVSSVTDPAVRVPLEDSGHLLDNNPLDFAAYSSSDNDVYNYFQNVLSAQLAAPTTDPAGAGGDLQTMMDSEATTFASAIKTDLAASSQGGEDPQIKRDLASSSQGEEDPLVSETLARLQLITAVLDAPASTSTPPPTGKQPGKPPPAKPSLKLTHPVNVKGAGANLTLDCTVAACTVVAVEKTTERVRKPSGKLVGVIAAHHRVVSKTVVVGTAKLTLRAGETRQLTIELDRTGRKLLARFKKLPIVLTVTLVVNGKQSTVSTRRLELKS
jgi:hypothetical protein